MRTEPLPAEVSAALARTRRRARYLEDATSNGHRSRIVSYVLTAAIGIYLIVTRDAALSTGTMGFLIVFASISGWQFHRLTTRVNALTKLLTDVGYPGEA
jgi:hypothetical protein